MWKTVLIGILSTKAFGANFSMEIGVGFGQFDEVNVPYGADSFLGGLEPRADGSISRQDVMKRFGLGVEGSIFRRDKLSVGVHLTHHLNFLQISGISGRQEETISSSSFDSFSWRSLAHLNMKNHMNSVFNSVFFPGFITGIGLQRTNWRNISTGHILDSANFMAGFEYIEQLDWQLSMIAEQLLFGRFAWDDKPFNLTPSAMQNLDLAHHKVELKLSYLKLRSISFNASAGADFTRIKFGNLQKSYAESGLEINPLIPSVQSRSLSSYSIVLGVERRL